MKRKNICFLLGSFQTGGAENIFFDWWSQTEEEQNEQNQVETHAEDKNKIQHILLNLCYKVTIF